MKPFREIRNGEVKINLHPGQTRAADSDARFPCVLAGTQSGKTCWGPEWVYDEIQRINLRSGPPPPGQTHDFLIVTASFPLLNLKLLPEFLYTFKTLYNLGEYAKNDKAFNFHDGSWRIIFGSADNADSLESATAKGAWLDEAGQKRFGRDSWDAVLRRLSINRGRALITTTVYLFDWLKYEVHDKALKGDPDYELIQFESIMNPAFPREEFEDARARLPKWKFDMFYRGVYSKPAGMIYDAFDEDVCKIKRFPIPQEWPRYVGCDFGGVNTAAMWYAKNPETQRLVAYREYHKGGLTAKGHAMEWLKLSEGEDVVLWCGGSKSEDQWRREFRNAGIVIKTPSVSDVEVGINRVYGYHAKDEIDVFDDLLGYLDEKGSYSRQLDDNNEPTEKIDDKEKYHRMDAERYVLSQLSQGARVAFGEV